MATLNLLLTMFLVITTNLNHLDLIKADDACPYPCNPPPIAGTTTTPILSPPATPQTGPYTPPTNSLPPPSDNLPNYPPGPDEGTTYGGDGGGGALTMPPPPDPILPYFPYYYRSGVHGQGDQSPSSMSSSASPRSAVNDVFLASVVVAGVVLFATFCS